MGVDAVFSDSRVVNLIGAATEGDTQRVRALVEEGVDPDAAGVQGATPLMWACLHDGRASVEALLAAGADPARCDDAGRSSVHLAAAADDPEPLDTLLEHGADPDLRNPRTGGVPLASAMMAAREQQFRRLLDAGADPRAVDDKGDTLLHVAGKINDTGRILTLLDAGADPTVRNRQGLNFKQYLSMTSPDVLTAEARQQLADIDAWLDEHGIELETSGAATARSSRGSGTGDGPHTRTTTPDHDDGAWSPGRPDAAWSPSVGSRWEHDTGELDRSWY